MLPRPGGLTQRGCPTLDVSVHGSEPYLLQLGPQDGVFFDDKSELGFGDDGSKDDEPGKAISIQALLLCRLGSGFLRSYVLS